MLLFFVVDAIFLAKGLELPAPAGTPKNLIEIAQARNLHKVSILLYILPTTTLIYCSTPTRRIAAVCLERWQPGKSSIRMRDRPTCQYDQGQVSEN